MAHIVFAMLRVAERWCSTKELAMHVMAERGMDTADRTAVRMMLTRVASCLRHYRVKGLLQSVKESGEYVR